MDTGSLIKLLIILLIVSAIGIGILTVYEKIKRVTRRALRVLSDVRQLASLAKGHGVELEEVFEETPKSVSSMTRLMEPQIMRDFPEFSWDECKHRAENLLTSALLSISANDASRLVMPSDEIKRQVENIIEENRLQGIGETYSDIQIHQTEIANYRKDRGKCVITIQMAVGYLHFKVKDGKVIKGDRNQKTQTKYNIEAVYIQDVEKVGSVNAIGTTCPHCGAPIISLGQKACEYCGVGVETVNTRVWSLHKFYEVDYN